MKENTKAKGDSLEDAVHAIETYIFASNPSLRNATFTFERNKIVILKGARNEIDLYITVEHGKGYSSIFLFECKNWNRKVGKNEIVVFSEKVEECKAQKGFFIAKEFTKDAMFRAKADGRIELHRVKTEITVNAFPVEFYEYKTTPKELIFKDPELKFGVIDKSGPFELHAEEISFAELVNLLVVEVDRAIANDNPELILTEQEIEYEKKFEFLENSFLYKQTVVEGIKGTFRISVKKIHPVVVSQYDIENRGRSYIIEHRSEAGIMQTYITSDIA